MTGLEARADARRGIFTPVSTGRISEEIVDQIKLAIREGRLRPGDRLPPERELTTRFGVSRMSVRDALRILETNGLIEIRVGARGGAFVRAPASSHVGEGLANLLMLSSISAENVTETRRVLEVGIVPLVVERATEDDVRVLTEICEESRAALRGDGHLTELSARFHIGFARAAHNPAIAMLIESLRGPLLMSLERARQAARAPGASGVREHAALVKAIRQRDAASAEVIMARHLGRTARRLASARRRG